MFSFCTRQLGERKYKYANDCSNKLRILCLFMLKLKSWRGFPHTKKSKQVCTRVTKTHYFVSVSLLKRHIPTNKKDASTFYMYRWTLSFFCARLLYFFCAWTLRMGSSIWLDVDLGHIHTTMVVCGLHFGYVAVYDRRRCLLVRRICASSKSYNMRGM